MNTLRTLLIAAALFSTPVTAGDELPPVSGPVQLSGVLMTNDMRLINHPTPEQEIKTLKSVLRINT